MEKNINDMPEEEKVEKSETEEETVEDTNETVEDTNETVETEKETTEDTKEDKKSPTGQGMNLIYKQLMTAFEEMGVTVIEAKGQQFDPELHNAVMHEDNDELEENVVVEEFQKGYKYRDSVIRHSMVKVAN